MYWWKFDEVFTKTILHSFIETWCISQSWFTLESWEQIATNLQFLHEPCPRQCRWCPLLNEYVAVAVAALPLLLLCIGECLAITMAGLSNCLRYVFGSWYVAVGTVLSTTGLMMIFSHSRFCCYLFVSLLLTLSPLSSHSIGSPDPELPVTTLYVTVFPRKFQANISSLREYIKDLQASISALRE